MVLAQLPPLQSNGAGDGSLWIPAAFLSHLHVRELWGLVTHISIYPTVKKAALENKTLAGRSNLTQLHTAISGRVLYMNARHILC